MCVSKPYNSIVTLTNQQTLFCKWTMKPKSNLELVWKLVSLVELNVKFVAHFPLWFRCDIFLTRMCVCEYVCIYIEHGFTMAWPICTEHFVRQLCLLNNFVCACMWLPLLIRAPNLTSVLSVRWMFQWQNWKLSIFCLNTPSVEHTGTFLKCTRSTIVVHCFHKI